MHLISVIVPVYNVLPYLREALDSVIHQTYKNLEIILIDDGSTDGSGEICDAYAEKDGRIVVIHQENRGLSAARNAGMDIMTGDVVAFLDSDDAYCESFIEKMLSVMIQKNADLVVCNYSICKTTGILKCESDENRSFSTDPVKYDRIHALRALVDGSLVMAAWNAIYRRELWREIRFPNGLVYEDVATSYRIVDSCKALYFLDQPLYLYRKRPGSITSTRTPKNVIDRIKVNSQYESFIKANIPEIFSLEQLKKRQKSHISLIVREYLDCFKSSADRNDPAMKELRKQIIQTKRRTGIKDCTEKTKATYCVICLCPSPAFLRIVYRLYRFIKR